MSGLAIQLAVEAFNFDGKHKQDAQVARLGNTIKISSLPEHLRWVLWYRQNRNQFRESVDWANDTVKPLFVMGCRWPCHGPETPVARKEDLEALFGPFETESSGHFSSEEPGTVYPIEWFKQRVYYPISSDGPRGEIREGPVPACVSQ